MSVAMVLAMAVALAPASSMKHDQQARTVSKRAADRKLALMRRELGKLAGKSLVASPSGHVFAQNMIYYHTVTVFDVDGNRVTDISDRVPRSLLGLEDKGFVRGAPVEGVVSPDGKSLFVSNYYILGKGFPGNIKDNCKRPEEADVASTAPSRLSRGRAPTPANGAPGWRGVKPSFVFQIDIPSFEIVRAIPVGATPKFLTLTQDGTRLLVANWCDFSLSIVDVAGREPTHHVKIGSFPRGIAVEPDGRTAYVTTMGRRGIAVVDLEKREVVRWLKGGRGPRHLLLGPEGKLYVSLSHESSVAIIDKQTGEVLARAKTGKSPRSMALSSDGSAIYVVNYREDSLAVVDTATMKVRQKIATGPYPIGVAFEPTNERVWVSCYGGSVRIYDSRGAPPHKSVKMIVKEEAKRFPP